MPMLPIDVVVKLAFAIPNGNDLFALIEALRPYMDLGPLEHLVQLSLIHPPSEVWPSLKLSAVMTDATSIASSEAIAKYYSHVIVDDSWNDVEWLKTNLAPEATIQWCVNRFPTTIDSMDSWTNLRITVLIPTLNSDTPAIWKYMLPRLHSLTCLHVEADSEGLDD
ncbi:unnamed protein product, partial [Aphanomyces euteiches]